MNTILKISFIFFFKINFILLKDQSFSDRKSQFKLDQKKKLVNTGLWVQQNTNIIVFGKMKNQVPGKMFKRKTSSLYSLHIDVKRDITEVMESGSKFLSPRNVKGLDCTMYKKEELVVRGLQQELNKLRQKVNELQQQTSQLREQNSALRQENSQLKKEIEEHNERQNRSKSQDLTTVDVLNQLKQKIDSLSDDQLSTVDQIDMEDICMCHQYESEIVGMKEKVRFLEQSLLHSQGIILRLQEDIKKIKVISKLDRAVNQIEVRGDSKGFRKMSEKLKGRCKMSLIEEIVEVNEE